MSTLPPDLQHKGVIAVSSVALFSLVSCVTVSASLLFVLWRERRKKSGDQATSTLLLSQFGLLYAGLIIADLVQATAFTLSFYWLFGNPSAQWTRMACNVQGAFLQFGDVASALCNCCIGLHTSWVVICRRTPPWWTVCTAMGAIALTSALLAFIGPIAIQRDDDGFFYRSTGYWCWISPAYQLERFTMHYLFVFFSAIMSCICYCVIFVSIRFRAKPTGAANTAATQRVDAVARKMLYFPAVYLVCILPIAVARVHAMLGRPVSFEYLLVAGCFFASGGACNILLFAYCRRTLSATPIFRRLSRGNSLSSIRSELSSFTANATAALKRHSISRDRVDDTTSFDVTIEGASISTLPTPTTEKLAMQWEGGLRNSLPATMPPSSRPGPKRSVSFSDALPTLAKHAEDDEIAMATAAAVEDPPRRASLSIAHLMQSRPRRLSRQGVPEDAPEEEKKP